MILSRLLTCTLCVVLSGFAGAATAESKFNPHLEHLAVWVQDLDKTAAFLQNTLGWRRHTLEFGVDTDSKVYGGMKLAFVDANGIWLELVQPTTPGPGMDFLKEKGKGSLVELDFFVDDFDAAEATIRGKGIQPMGMDGKPMVNGGLLTEWAIKDGKRVRGNERLIYLPVEVTHGTSVEIGWEYPDGVVLMRDAMYKDAQHTPRSAPHVDHAVVLAADLERTAAFYTNVLGLPRQALKVGLARDWMGVGEEGHAWIAGNSHGMWIELVQPAQSPAGARILKDNRFGDGMIMELGVEVPDIIKFNADMAAKGIVMTTDGRTPLTPGKAVVASNTGDSYSYLPLGTSEGMRILVFQRGPATSSLFVARDTAKTH